MKSFASSTTKHKAHFAELDEAGWQRMAEDVRDSHRADLNQVLAYGALLDAFYIVVNGPIL